MSVAVISNQKTIEQIITQNESRIGGRNVGGELGKDDFNLS